MEYKDADCSVICNRGKLGNLAFKELGQQSMMKCHAAIKKFMKNYKGRMFKIYEMIKRRSVFIEYNGDLCRDVHICKQKKTK